MTEKMPDEIYAFAAIDEKCGAWHQNKNRALDETSYTRKDLFTALQERNARLVEALELIQNDFIHGEKGRGISAEGILEICGKALVENKE